MNQQSIEQKIWVLIVLLVGAYLFSVGVRMYWPLYFSDAHSMYYAGQLMINTNDGYYFASSAKDMIEGITPMDQQRVSAGSFGLTTFTAFLAQLLPFPLETIILYLPSFVASLIVIPVILTGRLMGHTLLGFFAALLASIAWSYYNRTMVGYYDSDMFAVFLQFMIFYALLYVAYKKSLNAIIAASVLLLIYPYFYPQGLSITFAMFFLLTFYLVLEYFNMIKTTETDDFREKAISLYGSIILLSIVLMVSVPLEVRVGMFLLTLIVLLKVEWDKQKWIYLSILFFIAFLYFGNVLNVLTGKLMGYIERGVESEGLQFYQVIQTVREAGSIPFSTVANRISGSMAGLLLSLIGYGILVWRHKAFIIALPLIGVGLFAYVGGLRFTVYAVPIAALGAIYLFWTIGKLFKEKRVQYVFLILATVAMIYPNITHIISYKVPTVMNKSEVEDLVKLNNVSERKDYTLAWWDFGYPIWYYSDTSTLIDGGKHHRDNFIISTIMFSTSPTQVANLGKLAIETYVDSGYNVVANELFSIDENPKVLLNKLKKSDFRLPEKTRDVYLYMPYRMMKIFPTVGVFGNLDLITGKKKRKIDFYPTRVVSQQGNQLLFANGITFDTQNGKLKIGNQEVKVQRFDITQYQPNGKSKVDSNLLHMNGRHCVVYLKSYNEFVIMDIETYKSAYVQMFMLGNYDKNLFELVVSSPYSKIYKIK